MIFNPKTSNRHSRKSQAASTALSACPSLETGQKAGVRPFRVVDLHIGTSLEELRWLLGEELGAEGFVVYDPKPV